MPSPKIQAKRLLMKLSPADAVAVLLVTARTRRPNPALRVDLNDPFLCPGIDTEGIDRRRAELLASSARPPVQVRAFCLYGQYYYWPQAPGAAELFVAYGRLRVKPTIQVESLSLCDPHATEIEAAADGEYRVVVAGGESVVTRDGHLVGVLVKLGAKLHSRIL